MNPVTMLFLAAQILLLAFSCTQGQVSMENNPSFHRISYRVGPDGRTDMGGHGSELDRFFNGLGSSRSRAGFRNSGAIAGGPRFMRRRWSPMRSYFRIF